MKHLLAPLLVLSGCSEPAAVGRGGGVVSVNPCADAVLVRLVAPERIAAISHYSQDPAATSMPLEQARRFRATAGTAEEVIALRPSLVLASMFTPPSTRDAYRQAGLRVLFLDSPTTVAASVAQLREVAGAVGERGRGEAMVRDIKQALNSSPGRGGGSRRLTEGARGTDLPSPTAPSTIRAGANGPSPRPGEDPSALLFIAGDLANGSGTLLDELLTRAGFRNAAAEYGLTYTGRIPLETLAAHPPAVVIAPDDRGRTDALRRRLLTVPHATFPRHLINCGGPAIVPALARLRAIRAGL